MSEPLYPDGGEPFAILRAQLDQVAAGARDIAVAVAAYFHALCESGLERHEALELTRGWQAVLLESKPEGE